MNLGTPTPNVRVAKLIKVQALNAFIIIISLLIDNTIAARNKKVPTKLFVYFFFFVKPTKGLKLNSIYYNNV